MKKIYGLFVCLGMATTLFAQPDQWYVAIDPSEVETLLGPTRRKIDMLRVDGADIPTIDGIKDPVWDKVTPGTYDRYIQYYTSNSGGVYSRKSMLSDGDNNRRLPDNADDFSGTYRVIYDEDYIYCFFDIKDNEVNDNQINPGVKESFEFQEATYPDSAQQALKGKPYPPYTGPAGEINKKFCYWAYLGSFKMWFFLAAGGTCTSEFREKADATKINYQQRLQSCQCAWKLKDDGSGYTAEIGISLKVALADSAGNAYQVPATEKDTQWIAFEMKCFDEDAGMKAIQASWNAQDNNVWDAMIYAGKLMMKGWTLGSEQAKAEEAITFSPNPAVDQIQLSKTANVEIISITGAVVKSAQNATIVNVADLVPGVYVVKINGTAAGKMLKR